jgi:hypothetical protein
MSYTTTDCEIFGSGFSGVSTHRLLGLRMALDEQRTAALALELGTLP